VEANKQLARFEGHTHWISCMHVQVQQRTEPLAVLCRTAVQRCGSGVPCVCVRAAGRIVCRPPLGVGLPAPPAPPHPTRPHTHPSNQVGVFCVCFTRMASLLALYRLLGTHCLMPTAFHRLRTAGPTAVLTRLRFRAV
jgi:hypothetical protein